MCESESVCKFPYAYSRPHQITHLYVWLLSKRPDQIIKKARIKKARIKKARISQIDNK